MSFLRRNKNSDSAPPPPAEPALQVNTTQVTPASGDAKKAKAPASRNPIAGIRQWIIDSYNGLYKIVLQPSMPTISFVLLCS